MKWYQTAKFKKTQKKWYERLKKSGFDDQEKDELHIKQYSVKQAVKSFTNPTLREAKLQYYAMARQFLQVNKFKNKLQRRIFELHTDGTGIRVIAVELGLYRRKVHETLKELVRQMRGR